MIVSGSVFSTLCIGSVSLVALAGVFFLVFLPLWKKLFPALYYCKWNNQHDWVWEKMKGTCHEKSVCSRCKLQGEERINHQWVWNRVEGTCIEKSICSVCQTEGGERQLKHEWGEWEKPENECVERKKCTICAETGEERISHVWGDWERVEGFDLEKKYCIICGELGAERAVDLKAYCEACNGTGLVNLGGWNISSTCSVCGGTGVIKQYAEKE
jgi:hypothetical protein